MILENEILRAEVLAAGAELRRLTRKTDGYEYLWNANPAYWAKTSPVLFPVVGALKDDTYQYEGKTYHLPRHGFARNMQFDARQISSTCGEFSLTDSSETRQWYPFAFRLVLRYELIGDTLACTYTVTNTHDQQPLLFSIGGHPAFSAAGAKGKPDYTDYYLEFPDDDRLACHHVVESLISSEATTIALENHRLRLSYELFYADALVLKTLKSKTLYLRNTVNESGICFRYDNFPYFGIWAAKGADFVCLEPWNGIADAVTHNQQLENKEGIQQLPAGGEWTGKWGVTCF